MTAYAIPSDRPFVTTRKKEELLAKKQLSSEAKAIREFFRTHTISISVDPLTREGKARLRRMNCKTLRESCLLSLIFSSVG